MVGSRSRVGARSNIGETYTESCGCEAVACVESDTVGSCGDIDASIEELADTTNDVGRYYGVCVLCFPPRRSED